MTVQRRACTAASHAQVRFRVVTKHGQRGCCFNRWLATAEHCRCCRGPVVEPKRRGMVVPLFYFVFTWEMGHGSPPCPCTLISDLTRPLCAE